MRRSVARWRPETVCEAHETAHAVAIMDHPALIDAADVAQCAELLGAPGASGERHDRAALSLLAAIAYWRPNLPDAELVGVIERGLADAVRPAETHRTLGEILRLLVGTSAGPAAVRSVQALLARPDLEYSACDVLLDILAYAASWAPSHIDLASLLTIAENARLDDTRRIRLLNGAIEPTIFARLETVSP